MENRRENFFKKLILGVLIAAFFSFGFFCGIVNSAAAQLSKQLGDTQIQLFKCAEILNNLRTK